MRYKKFSGGPVSVTPSDVNDPKLAAPRHVPEPKAATPLSDKLGAVDLACVPLQVISQSSLLDLAAIF